MQNVHGVDADFFDRVTALHDEQGRHAELGDTFAHGQVVRAVELELRDRVILEGVDTQGHDDNVGAVAFDLFAGLLQRRAPGVPAAAGRQGVVEVEPFTRAFAPFIVVAEKERKLGFRMAVDRGE